MKKTSFSILLLFFMHALYSQKNLTAAGGEAIGNATISYSLGQVHYVAMTGRNNTSLSQGVQHGYLIIPEKSQSWKIPTGFIPNPEGSLGGSYDPNTMKNSIFFPIVEDVMDYQLLIFNRWGEVVFTSNDLLIGWDGYYQGSQTMCAQDVYVWKVKGKFSDGKIFDKVGSITLLK